MKPNDANASNLKAIAQDEEVFSEIVRLIAASREKAIQSVNTALIELYWEVGAMISRKIEAAEWGDGVVDQLAQFIARTEPTLTWLHSPELVQNEAILRGLQGRSNCVATGDTIAVVSSPCHPGAEQAPGRARILPPACHTREMEQA